ncbi:MAG: hypothetical protein ABSD88_18135 [Candidatus Korobacteraceae bacterium]|jgi:isocitrate/isopropylmalate dehydrogenase
MSPNQAIEAALNNPATRTRDIGGALGTQAFADVVVKLIRDEVGIRPAVSSI